MWCSDSVRDLWVSYSRLSCWLCCGVVILGKALYPHVHSLDAGVIRYLAGHGRCVCVLTHFLKRVFSVVMAAGLYTS